MKDIVSHQLFSCIRFEDQRRLLRSKFVLYNFPADKLNLGFFFYMERAPAGALRALGALTPYFQFFFWAPGAPNPYCGFTVIRVFGVTRAPGALTPLWIPHKKKSRIFLRTAQMRGNSTRHAPPPPYGLEVSMPE